MLLRIYVNADENETNPHNVDYTITQDLRDKDIRLKRHDPTTHPDTQPSIWAAEGENLKIKFILCDNTNLQLRFREPNPPPVPPQPHVDDPIWIATGSNCPTGPGLAGFSIVKAKPRKLVISNPTAPKDRVYYTYKLRIIDRHGHEKDFDPVIENGGGNQGILRPWWFAWVPLLGGVAFVGVAFMAAYAAGFL